jgi:UDP-glucose:(heptosyl)LPS alpha-1,3-glucosyltransferase
MRIALITRRFDPVGGGTERDLIVTARLLGAAGHQVIIYAGEIRGSSPDLTVRRVGTIGVGRTLRYLSFAAKAGSVARRDGADVVISFARVLDADINRSGGSAHRSYLSAAAAWQTRVQQIATRLSAYERVQTIVEAQSFRAPGLKRTIAVSDLVRRDLLETFRLDPAAVVTLYNGVDLARFRPHPGVGERRVRRAELGLPGETPALVFVGNGFARKGLAFLLRAWARLPSPAVLVIAGTDHAIRRYQSLSSHLGLTDRVRFLGPQPCVERLFTAVDGLVLPSLFEPFGNVVLEAMAVGLPALCSSACGAAEVVPSSMREFVVQDPTDIDELAQRLELLLRAGGDLYKDARAAAERFTWENHSANLLKIIA